jgi:hypothetical protein
VEKRETHSLIWKFGALWEADVNGCTKWILNRRFVKVWSAYSVEGWDVMVTVKTSWFDEGRKLCPLTGFNNYLGLYFTPFYDIHVFTAVFI